MKTAFGPGAAAWCGPGTGPRCFVPPLKKAPLWFRYCCPATSALAFVAFDRLIG